MKSDPIINQDRSIAYLLGNKGVTTFGRHYCDFKNSNNLLGLRQKLNRVHSEIMSSQNLEINTINFRKEVTHIFPNKRNKPLKVLFKIKVDDVQEIAIRIENKYGMEIHATYKEVNNG